MPEATTKSGTSNRDPLLVNFARRGGSAAWCIYPGDFDRMLDVLGAHLGPRFSYDLDTLLKSL
jgi:hypothetical protein